MSPRVRPEDYDSLGDEDTSTEVLGVAHGETSVLQPSKHTGSRKRLNATSIASPRFEEKQPLTAASAVGSRSASVVSRRRQAGQRRSWMLIGAVIACGLIVLYVVVRSHGTNLTSGIQVRAFVARMFGAHDESSNSGSAKEIDAQTSTAASGQAAQSNLQGGMALPVQTSGSPSNSSSMRPSQPQGEGGSRESALRTTQGEIAPSHSADTIENQFSQLNGTGTPQTGNALVASAPVYKLTINNRTGTHIQIDAVQDGVSQSIVLGRGEHYDFSSQTPSTNVQFTAHALIGAAASWSGTISLQPNETSEVMNLTTTSSNFVFTLTNGSTRDIVKLIIDNVIYNYTIHPNDTNDLGMYPCYSNSVISVFYDDNTGVVYSSLPFVREDGHWALHLTAVKYTQ